MLRRFSTHLPTKASFAAFYAAKAIGSSVKEVALFTLQHSELSRGILASLVFQSMLNLDQFKSEDQQAASEYENLRRQLLSLEAVRGMEWDQSLSSNDNLRMENVIQRRAEIDKRLSALEGRSEATTEDFSADVLKRLVGTAAYVHVMGSSHSCIALLISGTDQRTIDLPQLKASETIKNLNRLYGKSRLSKVKPLEVPQAGQELREILKWLWDTAVKPILSELGYYTKSKKPHSSQLPRLWWCASGVMSNLPFHAAGEGTEAPDSENVFDYAICSVTVSLTAIKMAQSFTAHLKGILNDGVLVVSMPTTPQLNDLKAKEELTSIEKAADIVPTNLINPKKPM